MAKLGTDDKRLFLIASGKPSRIDFFSKLITKHIFNSTIYTAADGFEALFKMENAAPHVALLDTPLARLTPVELSEKILFHPKLSDTSIVIVSRIPDKEHFVDQVVTGQIQFLIDMHEEAYISACLTRALNRLTDSKDFTYRLRFLPPDEILFREGDKAESVFILKRGQMQAFKGDGDNLRVLGNVTVGEFVGEMAHINGEPRSATVKSLSDCELIEIPTGTLDTFLFSKPAWSKALVSTLSKRLKRTNEGL